MIIEILILILDKKDGLFSPNYRLPAGDASGKGRIVRLY
jgi:hypothetical protein